MSPRIPFRRLLVGVAFGLALLGPGCFPEKRSVTQVDAQSRLKFSGNLSDAEFRLEREGREIWPWADIDDDELYQVAPGPCDIMVRRDGQLVVRRRVLLVGGQDFEVTVP